MNTRKAAAAIALAILAAAAFPALNRAQEMEVQSDDQISKEVEASLRQQENTIRGAEQAQMQAAQAQKVVIQAAKAAKDANRNFHVFFKAGEVSVPIAMRIREASRAVRDAKDDVNRKKASQELASALDEYFEENMKARSKELEDIRARLAKLEAQLERRREKKDEIIDLQMKVALNEADGLGFYSEPQDKMFNFPLPPPMTAWGQPGEIAITAPVRIEPTYPPAPPAPVAVPAPAASPEPQSNPR